MTEEQGAVTLADLGAKKSSFSTRKSQRSRLAFQTIEEAFPEVDPGHRTLGSRVLVQIRLSAKKTAGGLELVHDTQDTEKWNAQVGKVIEVGPLAYRDRDTMKPWPEGAWVEKGMYVRVPKYGGDRFEVPLTDSTENDKVVFVFYEDTAMIAEVTGDPLQVVSYI